MRVLWPSLKCFFSSPVHFLLQVYYSFNPIFMLAEPLMLATAFFLCFVASVAYIHIDLSLSKSWTFFLNLKGMFLQLDLSHIRNFNKILSLFFVAQMVIAFHLLGYIMRLTEPKEPGNTFLSVHRTPCRDDYTNSYWKFCNLCFDSHSSWIKHANFIVV